MSASVLIDGHNLTLQNSTGIGTYAAQSRRDRRHMGFRPELLLGGNSSVDRKRPAAQRNLPLRRADATEAVAEGTARAPAGELTRQAFRDSGRRNSRGSARLRIFRSPPCAASTRSMSPRACSNSRARISNATARCADVKRPSAGALSSDVSGAAQRPEAARISIRSTTSCRCGLPQTTLDNKKVFLKLVRHLCRKADHIVTVSEFSKQDIVRLFGLPESRITNTYQSVDIPASSRRRATTRSPTRLRGVRSRFPQLLHVLRRDRAEEECLAPDRRLCGLREPFPAHRRRRARLAIRGRGREARRMSGFSSIAARPTGSSRAGESSAFPICLFRS